MPRYRLTVEYNGTGLYGWQRQDGVPTVQEHIERAIHAFCGETVTLHCAGRTDAGVHALGQVSHIDLVSEWPDFQLLQAVNFHLQDTAITIVEAQRVDENFHARFSAKGRRYLYRIVNRSARLGLDIGRAWHMPKPLDALAMAHAARLLIGTHDFTSFRDSQCQAKSPVKTLDELRVETRPCIGGQEIRIHAASRSFLHHQVRIMTGSLAMIGQGKWTEDDLLAALAAKDRKAGGPTAPADGLYFMSVSYDEE